MVFDLYFMHPKTFLHVYPNCEGHLQALMGSRHSLCRDTKVHILGTYRAESRKRRGEFNTPCVCLRTACWSLQSVRARCVRPQLHENCVTSVYGAELQSLSLSLQTATECLGIIFLLPPPTSPTHWEWDICRCHMTRPLTLLELPSFIHGSSLCINPPKSVQMGSVNTGPPD